MRSSRHALTQLPCCGDELLLALLLQLPLLPIPSPAHLCPLTCKVLRQNLTHWAGHHLGLAARRQELPAPESEAHPDERDGAHRGGKRPRHKKPSEEGTPEGRQG